MVSQERSPWAIDAEHSERFGDVLRDLRRARGLRQIDLAEQVGFDHSVISRFETRGRVPGATDVTRLARALRLSDDERDRLEAAFARDLLDRNGLATEVLLSIDEAISIAADGVAAARELRFAGRPHVAVAAAKRSAQLARHMATQTSSDSARGKLLGVLSEILTEQSKGFLDFVLPRDSARLVLPIVEEQKRIAEYLHEPILAYLAAISREGVLYLSGRHEEANAECRALVEVVPALSDVWAREVVRASSINAGLLGDEEELDQAEQLTRSAISNAGPDQAMEVVSLLEGLARGESAFDSQRAHRTMDEAWTTLQKGRTRGDFSSLRFVQLVRTELKMLAQVNSQVGPETERLAEEALRISTGGGYHRYEAEIQSLVYPRERLTQRTPGQQTSQVFNTVVSGGVVSIAQNVSNDAQAVTVDLKRRDLRGLLDHVAGAGATDQEINDLRTALSGTEPAATGEIGPRAREWVTRVAARLAASAGRVGEAVTVRLLTDAIARYLGV